MPDPREPSLVKTLFLHSLLREYALRDRALFLPAGVELELLEATGKINRDGPLRVTC